MTVVLFALAVALTPAQDIARVDAAMRAGDLATAERILNEVALPPTVEARLLGLIRLKQARYKDAAAIFGAIEPKDPALYLSLAAAEVELGAYKSALAHLENAEPPAQGVPLVQLLRARAYVGLARPGDAFAALTGTEHDEVRLARVQLLAAHDRALEAVREAEPLLKTPLARRAGEALARTRAGLPYLEKLAASGATEDRELLGKAYAALGELDAAAAVLLDVEAVAPGRVSALVEDLLARGGRVDEALAMNDRTGDLERRVQILFDDGQYSAVAALARVIEAPSVVTRYRLAYAHYNVHAPAAAKRWCRTLRGTELESAAGALLDAMGDRW